VEWTADIMVPYRTGHKTGLQRLTDRVEHIMRTVEENYEEVVIGGRRVTNLRTLLASTQERIRKFFKDLVQESARYNTYINAQKSKTMVVSRQDNISVQVDHEGELLEQVHDFKFLGSYKSADGDCTKEIKRRIAMARQKAVVLASIWKDRKIKTATKVKVMKSMVWAVFEYGVEGWTLNKSDRNRIETFKMWFWRKMLSISWQEHRTND